MQSLFKLVVLGQIKLSATRSDGTGLVCDGLILIPVSCVSGL